MKIIKVIALVLIVVVIGVIFTAPIGPFPGFFIGGTPTQVPATWPDTSGLHEIRLEVDQGLLPRVVIIWVIQVDGALHVAGSNESGWVRMLGDGGPVRVRIRNETYALQAERLTSDWQRVLQAYVDKYRPDYPDIVGGFPPVEEAADIFAVFRLTAPGGG
ncbi:MAG: hypothetical protein O3A63_03930 [Proteobacteria bacterium]|nr:hypothetical protein [Pseudomonadota bacterium]